MKELFKSKYVQIGVMVFLILVGIKVLISSKVQISDYIQMTKGTAPIERDSIDISDTLAIDSLFVKDSLK